MKKKTNITIDDIARDLGVSKTTVSRAISGKGRISNATRERIQEYIQRTNYRPSAAAKGLAESKTYNVALVVPRSLFKMDMPFTRKSMTAICEEAFLQDYNILLCLSTDDNSASLLRTLDNRKVDGVILSRTVENDKLIDILTDRDIPFATMGSLPASAKGKATVEADHDHISGCCAFTIAFLRSGNGDVAVLGNDMNYIVNQSRLEGFYKGAAAVGLTEQQIQLHHGLQSAVQCCETVDQLLSQGIRRFITMDDEICMNVLLHLKERGLQNSEEIQVGTFYDNAQIAAWTPAVPSLQFDASELGRVACRELIRYLRNEDFNAQPTLGYRLLIK